MTKELDYLVEEFSKAMTKILLITRKMVELANKEKKESD